MIGPRTPRPAGHGNPARGPGVGADLPLLILLLAAVGCGSPPLLPWAPGMTETPAVHPDEALFPPPQASLHRDGEVRTSRFQAAFELRNPLPAEDRVLREGARLYAVTCRPCHGSEGRGDGPVASHFSRQPTDLTGSRVAAQPDGYIYATIRDGGGSMPGYGGSLDRTERWAIIHYVRSLQR